MTEVELGPDGKILVPGPVQDAIRTLIEWAGDDPSREGLLDTPSRVVRAYEEHFGGYGHDPKLVANTRYDPAGAKALLDRYGYIDRDGDGWRELPDGKPLVIRRGTSPSTLVGMMPRGVMSPPTVPLK